MRVVIAPDSYGGSLSAVEAAAAIAAGWQHASPEDELILAPMSDGGEGFVSVVGSIFRRVQDATVRGPDGEPTRATWVLAEVGDRRVAVIECAQACGLHRVEAAQRDALTATSYGVGELITAALD
ncbi:MAG: glycerate kinase, partial [Frankia sp.]|nr:glycerate kinase [Frankia sp.]